MLVPYERPLYSLCRGILGHADDAEDAGIPETGFTFGRLKRAQARGDIRALLARGRRVAHVHLARPEDVARDAALRPT